MFKSFQKFVKTLTFNSFLKDILYLSCTGADFMLLSIVKITVLKNLPHILHKLIRIGIRIIIKLLLNSTHVHWLRNDIKIVHNTELDRIHRLIKPKRTF